MYMSDNELTKPYLLVGANIRFLAENALRHGHSIYTVDHYGDWDTRKISRNRSLVNDADGNLSMLSLAELAHGIENAGIIYGPGFENDLRAVLRLKKSGTLLGCDITAIRSARSPAALSRVASTWGFEFPKIKLDHSKVRGAGPWLAKPLDGMGGEGITFFEAAERPPQRPTYYQEFVEGLPSSAAVVSDGSEATVLGVMTQLVGLEAFGASGFRFVGNVFPHPFTNEIMPPAKEIASALTVEFGLKGLWGFDFIYSGELTLIEVNPRPSAGMGVLGMATFNDLLGMHLHGVSGTTPSIGLDPGLHSGYTAQARVFARRDCVFSGPENWRKKGAKDIPPEGEFIASGAPVLTLHATGPTYKGVMDKLEAQAETLHSSLTPAQPASAL